MTSLKMIQQMIDYHYGLYAQVWDSIMTLTDEQFTQEIPYSIGSLRNHMVHLANVDMGWVRGLQSDPNARFRLDPADYPTRESARDLFNQTMATVKAYIAGLDEAALTHQPAGLPLNTWQALLHVVNHGTDHRAQILRALHDFGAPTFDQDAAYFLIAQNNAAQAG